MLFHLIRSCAFSMRFCKAAPQGDVGTNFLKLEVFFFTWQSYFYCRKFNISKEMRIPTCSEPSPLCNYSSLVLWVKSSCHLFSSGNGLKNKRTRRISDCCWTGTPQNHLVRKRTPNHLAKLD